MHRRPSPYDKARLYDIAFSYRDYGLECDAVVRWYGGITSRESPASVLELAAGPGRHALEFARRGLAAHSLDLSPAMVLYARGLARQEDLRLKAQTGDMRAFALDRKFDLALLMMNSDSHLLTVRDLVRHLRCVGRHLHSGGVYVVETALPDKRGSKPHATTDWTIHKKGDSVRFVWGRAGDRHDARRKATLVTIELVTDGRSFVTQAWQRQWTAAEVESAIRRAGCFDRVHRHGSFEPGAKAWRMIYVLRRRQRPSES
jgi:SAM-dependent methyltransferase